MKTWEALADDSPLNDPDYDPETKPVGLKAPAVVAKWGPRSQVRWFARHPELRMSHDEWERFYVGSTEHRGRCCISCLEDQDMGYGSDVDGCCCRAVRTT